MADVTRYMPGVGFAQGEGNRDTPILRGNSTTVRLLRRRRPRRRPVLPRRLQRRAGRSPQGAERHDLRPRRRRRRAQSRHPPGGLGAVAGSGAPARLVGRQAAHRRPRPGRERGRGRARDRRSTKRPTRIATASTSSATASIRPWPCRLGPATTLRGSYEYLPRRARRRSRHLVVPRAGRSRPTRARSSATRSRARRTRRCNLVSAGARAPVRSAGHAAQPSQLRELRQVLPERLPGRGERGGHGGRDLGLQQREHAAERLQPDRSDRRGADRPVRPHPARGHRVRPAGHRQLPEHGLLHRASARTSRPSSRRSARRRSPSR